MLTKLSSQFKNTLNDALMKRYKRRASSAQVARDFSSSSGGCSSISRETVRKWRNGSSYPNSDQLLLLVKWLDPDPNIFMQCDSGQ